MDPLRTERAVLRPRFTLLIFYLFGFFFLYCFALVAPALWEVFQSMPPGPEQEEAAKQAAQQAAAGRMGIAAVAAIVTTGIGMYKDLLPGTR